MKDAPLLRKAPVGFDGKGLKAGTHFLGHLLVFLIFEVGGLQVDSARLQVGLVPFDVAWGTGVGDDDVCQVRL